MSLFFLKKVYLKIKPVSMGRIKESCYDLGHGILVDFHVLHAIPIRMFEECLPVFARISWFS